jgi:hypothetical protein
MCEFWHGTGVGEKQFRANLSRLFNGEAGRRFWIQTREHRIAASENRRSRRFCQIVDQEYQKAIISGSPTVPAEGPSSAGRILEQHPLQSGNTAIKSGTALLLGAVGGAALGRLLWQKHAS